MPYYIGDLERPAIREHTLNLLRDPIKIQGIFLKRGFGVSGVVGAQETLRVCLGGTRNCSTNGTVDDINPALP